MKSSRQVRKEARSLFRLCIRDGKLDHQRVRSVVGQIISRRPRRVIQMLREYQRLVRLQAEREQVVVESSAALEPDAQKRVTGALRARFGEVAALYRVRPELLGGLRIRLGSDVWDGSLLDRLQRLRAKI